MQLAQREAQFRARLLPRLRDCEAGYGTLLFLAEDRAAAELPRYVRDPDADELLAEAMLLVAERAELRLPCACLAAKYVDACRGADDSDREPCMGPRRLATELLHWLDRGALADSLGG